MSAHNNWANKAPFGLEEAVFDVDRFSDGLMAAVEAAQVGFHFEEGGCWGMAAALHQGLIGRGVPAALCCTKQGFVHAWVSLPDANLDYRGTMSRPSSDFELVAGVESLREIAESFGVDEMAFDNDLATAVEIVASAFNSMFEPIPALW